MKKSEVDQMLEELPLEGLLLQCKTDKYKLAYSAIRWAKEIKQKENLPDPVQSLVPRALRDILLGKTTIKEIEKLPLIVKLAPPPAAAPAQPTLTLNVAEDEKPEPAASEK